MSGPEVKTERMDAESVEVFVRLSADEATDNDMQSLEDWAENAPEKLDELEELSNIWDQVGTMEVDETLFFEEEPRERPSLTGWISSLFQVPWMVPAGALAAVVLMVAVNSLNFLATPPVDRPSFATVRGSTQSIALADGSQVQLNGLSRLEVSFTDTERRIDLLEGEAYFEVKPDRNRQFVVSVAGGEVRAIGTAFDVDAGRDGTTVIVTEGTVGIRKGSADGRFSAGTKVLIPADAQQIEDFVITKLVLDNYEDAITWRDGVLTFAGEPLSVALERINRQSSKRIVLGDPSLADLQIYGSFRQDNVESFLTALENLYRIRVVESSHRIALFAGRRVEESENAPENT